MAKNKKVKRTGLAWANLNSAYHCKQATALSEFVLLFYHIINILLTEQEVCMKES